MVAYDQCGGGCVLLLARGSMQTHRALSKDVLLQQPSVIQAKPTTKQQQQVCVCLLSVPHRCGPIGCQATGKQRTPSDAVYVVHVDNLPSQGPDLFTSSVKYTYNIRQDMWGKTGAVAALH